MMKKYLLGILFTGIIANTFAQSDCTGGRYYTPVFASVDSLMDVTYGSATNNGSPQSLEFDMWMPSGDVFTERPVVILAHGGSFIGGDKSDPGVREHCRWLARMGYVAISMEYRLANPFDVVLASDKESLFVNIVYKAVHDQMACIRFLHKSVATEGNPYKINENIIIVGGFSAGSILGMHTTYMDDPSKLHPDIDVASDGGFYGESGNPGYPYTPQAVLNFCGALADTTYMVSGDQPMMSMHGTADNTVPYGTAMANPGVPIMVVHGSGSVHIRAQNVGVTNPLLTYVGKGHCEFWDTPSQADSSFQFVADFLQEQICIQGLFTEQNPNSVFFSVYPNPATTNVVIDIPGNNAEWQLHLINAVGQEIRTAIVPNGQNIYNLDVQGITPGMYVVTLNAGNRTASQKIMIK